MSDKPVAIITGAASGIGNAVATHLYGLGYKVVVADVNPSSGSAAASKLGPDALFVQTDVRSYASQAALFRRAHEWGGGRVDFFHANAGIPDIHNLFEKEMAVDEKGDPKPLDLVTMEVDLLAVFQGMWLFKFWARRNKGRKGGKIVITSSTAGLYKFPSNTQYAAAKHGLVGLTRSAGEFFLAEENISVNCICPAFIITGLAPRDILPKFPKEHVTPMSTAIKAIDAILADDKMTGQAIELSLDQIYFRQQVDFPNESSKWLGEGAGGLWEMGYPQSKI
ncbi:hypothetical protein BDY21DRAFT_338751 [Lineolata rhizophorae]|uniref:15-hydroxyprostaglandin dehydrogenase n=1 Tax=Lineolata rhizophorae TaxID=578093 RepID=A0A6A6P794_9PEZI|nr:hypothetical protein BDY21DRAFT_338751 [Lineolata rhizophorae]